LQSIPSTTKTFQAVSYNFRNGEGRGVLTPWERGTDPRTTQIGNRWRRPLVGVVPASAWPQPGPRCSASPQPDRRHGKSSIPSGSLLHIVMILGGGDVADPLLNHTQQAAPRRRGHGCCIGPRAVAPRAGCVMLATPQSRSVVVLGGDDGRWRWRHIDEPGSAYLSEDGITSVGGCGMKEQWRTCVARRPLGDSVDVAVGCLLRKI
jgi:hypothetical protein